MFNEIETTETTVVTHPGAILKIEYLEKLGLSVTEAAEYLGVNRKTLSMVVNGRAGISPEMALRLSKVFNTSPKKWLQLQLLYDLKMAEMNSNINVNPIVKSY